MSPPGIEILIGPYLIGAFLNAILYGVFLLQAFIYYRAYRRDASWIRYFILYLFVIETANTWFVFGMVYEPLILRNGTPRVTEIIPIMTPTEPIVTVLIATPVQCFIAWRIKVISKSNIIPAIIVLFYIASLGGGIWTGSLIFINTEFATLKGADLALITWFISSAITDILVTITLSYSLYKRKTGIKATDDKLTRIIQWTIHTGALTSLEAITATVLFNALPVPTVIYAFDFCLPKLYSNVLLSTLNARAGWDNLNGQHHEHNVLFGENPSTSSASSGAHVSKGRQLTSVKRNPSGIYELSTFKCEPATKSATGSSGIEIEPEAGDDEIMIHVTKTMRTFHGDLPRDDHGGEVNV